MCVDNCTSVTIECKNCKDGWTPQNKAWINTHCPIQKQYGHASWTGPLKMRDSLHLLWNIFLYRVYSQGFYTKYHLLGTKILLWLSSFQILKQLSNIFLLSKVIAVILKHVRRDEDRTRRIGHGKIWQNDNKAILRAT